MTLLNARGRTTFWRNLCEMVSSSIGEIYYNITKVKYDKPYPYVSISFYGCILYVLHSKKKHFVGRNAKRTPTWVIVLVSFPMYIAFRAHVLG